MNRAFGQVRVLGERASRVALRALAGDGDALLNLFHDVLRDADLFDDLVYGIAVIKLDAEVTRVPFCQQGTTDYFEKIFIPPIIAVICAFISHSANFLRLFLCRAAFSGIWISVHYIVRRHSMRKGFSTSFMRSIFFTTLSLRRIARLT